MSWSQDLLSQIEEYRKFKLLGEHLEAKHQERAQYYSKAPTELIYEDAELVHDKTTIDLFLAFSNILAKKKRGVCTEPHDYLAGWV